MSQQCDVSSKGEGWGGGGGGQQGCNLAVVRN